MSTDKLTMTASRVVAMFTDAALFASADTNRPILNTVKLTASRGRVQAVAIDSYALGIFTCDAEGTMDALVPLDDVKRIVALAKTEAKAYRAMPTELVFELDGGTLTVTGRDASITCRLMIGEFPNWTQLLGRNEPGASIGLSTLMLARLGAVTLGKPKSKKNQDALGLAFEIAGPLKPAHVHAEHDGIDFYGLVMPYRCGQPVPESVEIVRADATTHFPNGTVDHGATVAS